MIWQTLAYKPRGNNEAKRYRSRCNAVAWQEHQPAHEHKIKRDMDQVKEGKINTQAIPSPKKRWDAKNENPKTHSCRKS